MIKWQREAALRLSKMDVLEAVRSLSVSLSAAGYSRSLMLARALVGSVSATDLNASMYQRQVEAYR